MGILIRQIKNMNYKVMYQVDCVYDESCIAVKMWPLLKCCEARMTWKINKKPKPKISLISDCMNVEGEGTQQLLLSN